jgi:hypothetical protein
MNRIALLALTVSLAACNGAPPSIAANSMTSAGATEPAADNIAAATAETPTPAPTSAPSAEATTETARTYSGRWIGVEGMYLDVTPTGATTATLKMRWGLDADMEGRFPASVTRDGLRFTRDGETLLLRPSDGDATGLKWLAGKKDCLTVATDEGYCRA